MTQMNADFRRFLRNHLHQSVRAAQLAFLFSSLCGVQPLMATTSKIGRR